MPLAIPYNQEYPQRRMNSNFHKFHFFHFCSLLSISRIAIHFTLEHLLLSIFTRFDGSYRVQKCIYAIHTHFMHKSFAYHISFKLCSFTLYCHHIGYSARSYDILVDVHNNQFSSLLRSKRAVYIFIFECELDSALAIRGANISCS